MPALKTLLFDSILDDHAEDIENLKQQLCPISINEDQFSYYTASPFKEIDRGEADMAIGCQEIDTEWIWEIRAKRQDLFAKVDIDNDESDDSYDIDDD